MNNHNGGFLFYYFLPFYKLSRNPNDVINVMAYFVGMV